MVKSNTNQFISINLSSTCIAVLLFGLDVLCVFFSPLFLCFLLHLRIYLYNQFRETVRAPNLSFFDKRICFTSILIESRCVILFRNEKYSARIRENQRKINYYCQRESELFYDVKAVYIATWDVIFY